MIGWVAWLVSKLTGAGGIAKELRQAYSDRLAAQNDGARIAAEERIEKLKAASEMAKIANASLWSATNLGRLLIVLPWGLHWAAIYVVSIVNGLFATSLTILAVPGHINEMALVLIPAITIADAGAITLRRFGRR